MTYFQTKDLLSLAKPQRAEWKLWADRSGSAKTCIMWFYWVWHPGRCQYGVNMCIYVCVHLNIKPRHTESYFLLSQTLTVPPFFFKTSAAAELMVCSIFSSQFCSQLSVRNRSFISLEINYLPLFNFLGLSISFTLSLLLTFWCVLRCVSFGECPHVLFYMGC